MQWWCSLPLARPAPTIFIDTLPGLHQHLIKLHYARGLTLRQIAGMLNLTEWQTQERRREAIRELRDRLIQWDVIDQTPALEDEPVQACLF